MFSQGLPQPNHIGHASTAIEKMRDGSKDLVPLPKYEKRARGVVGRVCRYLLVFLDRWRPFPGTAGWRMPSRCRRHLSASRSRPKRGLRGLLYRAIRGSWNMGPIALERKRKSSRPSHLSIAAGQLQQRRAQPQGRDWQDFHHGRRGRDPARIPRRPALCHDANPDSGDLVERALGEGIYQQATPPAITDLFKNSDSIDSLTELSRYMYYSGGLHLVAGEQDPEMSDSLTAK